METIGKRIRRLRGFLGLTQEEFASRLGSARNTIAGYEIGNREPSNQALTLICNVFNVNPDWLKSGKGEMLVKKDEPLDALARKYRLTKNDKALIKAFVTATDDERAVVVKLIKNVHAEINSSEEEEADLHADLQRELDEQKKAEDKSTGSASTSA